MNDGWFYLLFSAIVTLKEELMVFKKSKDQPVLEEFIPIKKTYDDDPKVENDKKNWLSSTHLWNTNENDSGTNLNNHVSKQNSVEQVIQKVKKIEEKRVVILVLFNCLCDYLLMDLYIYV